MLTLKNTLPKATQSTVLLSCLTAALLSGCAGASSPTTSTTNETATTAAKTDAKLVEIRLVDTIDEARGYCVDIAGGKGENAPLDKGLQAHTCYDYTGELLVDQSFDTDLMKQGQFKIPYFNVCMTATSLQVGSTIDITACGTQDTQKFALQANGNLVPTAKPELCITVNSTEKREGRGATPVHVMRPLSLQACSTSDAKYQTWTTFSF